MDLLREVENAFKSFPTERLDRIEGGMNHDAVVEDGQAHLKFVGSK
jgi:hypothetical protein